MIRPLIALAAIAAVTACSSGVASEAQIASQPARPDSGLDGAPPPLAAPPAVLAPQTMLVIAPPAPAFVRAKDDTLWCDIAIKRTPSGVRFTPLVRSERAVSGEYSLIITKSGRSGSSDISQGGPFDALRDVKQALGASEISLEPGAKFRAVLKVRSSGQEVCREIRS